MISLQSARGRDGGLHEPLAAGRSQAQASVVFLDAGTALHEPGASLSADHRR
jgi:hypothetical protein